MRFTETSLQGAYRIELEKKEDERGFFSRLFCQKEFAAQGLESNFVQANNSYNVQAKTLRGLHYQLPPLTEAKLIRCIHGSLYDVILDLRPHSLTFKHSFSRVLSAANREMLYVPPGFAHGFITLEADTEVIYLVSEYYSPELERGLRWNDPAFAIQWPFDPEFISARDSTHADCDLASLTIFENN